MKKRISFRLFCTVVWRGICQVPGYIAGLFGRKSESTFGKVIWGIFAGSVTAILFLFAVCLIYAFCRNVVVNRWIGPKVSGLYWEDRHISNDIVFQWQYGRNGAKRLYNEAAGKVLMRNLDWVAVSSDKDSLAVFAKNGRRGYLNRFTGEVVIPADDYTRAWVFSEGLAAVEKDRRLIFIDHSGKTVIDKGFRVHFDNPKYAFRNGYCVLREPVFGRVGLIDRNGNWALFPEYDKICNVEGFWKVRKGGNEGLFTACLDTMFTVTHPYVTVNVDMIEVGYADHTSRLYDFDGNVICNFVVDRAENIFYQTDELREHEDYESGEIVYEPVYEVADCLRYIVCEDDHAEYCGLMDRQGKCLTPPDYESIEAVAKDRYLCHPQGIILDDKGNVVPQM